MARKSTIKLVIKDAAEDVPRLVLGSGPACGGTAYLAFRPIEAKAAIAIVTGKGKTKSAVVWIASGTDAPTMPATPHEDPGEVIAAVKAGVTDARPPVRRGTWRGTATCDESGGPVITFRRKVASYGELVITSGPKGWTWTVERAERWFADGRSNTGSAKTLGKAIADGYKSLDVLVAAACVVRDTKRGPKAKAPKRSSAADPTAKLEPRNRRLV